MNFLRQSKFIAWCKQPIARNRARALIIGAVALVFAAGGGVLLAAALGSNGYKTEPVESVRREVSPVLRHVREDFSQTNDDAPEEYEPCEDYCEDVYDEIIAEEPIYTGPVAMLTGLPISEEYLHRRPMAVVMNNIFAALPQTGISYADVVYEVLAEGNVTRFVTIFQSRMPEMVGPVRSTRNYFPGMAMNHDAFLVHHGGSFPGYDRIRELRLNALDGSFLGRVFWRDFTFPEWSGRTGRRAMEHASYTGWEQVSAHMSGVNMRATVGDDEAFGFAFGEIPEEIARLEPAEHISVPFSTEYTRIFTFMPDSGLYQVSNPRGAQVDVLTEGGGVYVANILVQITAMRVVNPRDGARNVDTIGTGDGYLFTQGQRFAVRWEKDSHASPMRWYFECGTPIVLTPGMTWICVLQNTAQVRA